MKARVLYLTVLKRKKCKLNFTGWNRPVCHLFGFTSVFLSKFFASHPRRVKRIVTALMPILLFCCFSLFLPHLRTLAQEERWENFFRFGTGGPTLCLYPLLSRNIIFFLALTMAARAKNYYGEACTIGILSTLTFTEFDCVSLLAIL